jgi:hypothetical protein
MDCVELVDVLLILIRIASTTQLANDLFELVDGLGDINMDLYYHYPHREQKCKYDT